MIEMLMKPGPQDIRYRLGKVTPPTLGLRINRIAHDSKIGLLGMGHHRGRDRFWLALVRHCWVAIGRLGMHHRWVGFWIPSVHHSSWYWGRLTGAIFMRKGIRPRCHPAVRGIPIPLGHRLQVPDRREYRTRSSHRHMIAHRPGRVLACTCGVFAGEFAIRYFGGCI